MFLGHVVRNTDVVSHQDVFFWSVFAGADDIMLRTWERCDRPVQNAVLGVVIARHMLKKIRYGHFHYQILKRLERIETWAVGLLDTATEEETALAVISVRIIPKQPYHLLDLALHARTKKLLSHRYADRFMAREWRAHGSIAELTHNFSWLMLFLDILCPVRYAARVKMDRAENIAEPVQDMSLLATRAATRVHREARDKALLAMQKRENLTPEQMRELRDRRQAKRQSVDDIRLSEIVKSPGSPCRVRAHRLLAACRPHSIHVPPAPPAVGGDEEVLVVNVTGARWIGALEGVHTAVDYHSDHLTPTILHGGRRLASRHDTAADP